MDHHGKNIVSPAACWIVWAGTIVGFVLTLLLSGTSLGGYYTLVAVIIAVLQALAVMAYYMHVRFSSRLTVLFAAAGIYWVAILFILGLADYFSRGWLR